MAIPSDGERTATERFKGMALAWEEACPMDAKELWRVVVSKTRSLAGTPRTITSSHWFGTAEAAEEYTLWALSNGDQVLSGKKFVVEAT